ncbi:uncharacterized protein LOC123534694 [Mercenaria mercenaria]|uniref:uncharacterized protein LOC123534694 n=1 Tax=Mercenaria mercenaria TaxID=6596 RepID=UPI00234EDA96|nr:uncharacterized protein LOC123534694 [Mercenaria mercenaria]
MITNIRSSTNMDAKAIKLALCTCLFLTIPTGTEQQVLTVMKTIAGITYNVVEFSGEVTNVMDILSGGGSGGITTQYLDKAVESITRNINAAKMDVLNSILLQSKFDRIDDAVIGIRSSLTDLKNYIEANELRSKHEYQKLFIKRYDTDGIEMKIRFLPQVLTYEVPGRSGQLLSLLTETTRCNLTALYEFQIFYLDLLSSGIALEMAYLKVSTHVQIQNAMEYWRNPCENIQQAFEKVVNECESKFVTYANEDIADTASPTALWTKNNRWFPWKLNDVFFSQARQSFQFVYVEYEDGSMVWTKTKQNNRFSVFYDNPPELCTLPSNTLENATELLKAAIKGEDDKEAAKNIGTSAKNYLSTFGYGVKSLLVIFDNGGFTEIPSKESQALKAELKGIKMKYCDAAEIRCKAADWGGGWNDMYDLVKEPVGNFKIYAYIYKESVGGKSKKPHNVGCGNSLKSLPLVILLLVGALAICARKFAF